MPQIPKSWIEKEIRKLMVNEGYSPRQTYEELKRRADENNWEIKGTTGFSSRERNFHLKKMVKERLTLFEKLKYYLRLGKLPGKSLEELRSEKNETRSEDRISPQRERVEAWQKAHAGRLEGEGPPESLGSGDVERSGGESVGLPAKAGESVVEDRLRHYRNEGYSEGEAIREVLSETGSDSDMIREVADRIGDWPRPGEARKARKKKGLLDRLRGMIPGVMGESGGGKAYRAGGFFRIYVERTIAVLLFLISGTFFVGTLMGGLGDLFTPSGIFWTVVFALSSYWWGAVLHFRFPGKGWLDGATISDEALMGLWAVGAALTVLGFTGSIGALSIIPFFGPIIASMTPGTTFLVAGLIGILVLYHAEEMPGQMVGYASAAVSGGRRAAVRINEAPSKVTKPTAERIGEAKKKATGEAELERLQDFVAELRGAEEIAFEQGDIGETAKSDIEDLLRRANEHIENGDIGNAQAQIGNVIGNYGDVLEDIVGEETLAEILSHVREG